MRKILADAGAERERIFDGRVHVRGTFHIAKPLVHQIRGGLRKTGNGAAGFPFGRCDDFPELREVGNVAGRRHEIEMFLVELIAMRIEIGERGAVGERIAGGSWASTTDSASTRKR